MCFGALIIAFNGSHWQNMQVTFSADFATINQPQRHFLESWKCDIGVQVGGVTENSCVCQRKGQMQIWFEMESKFHLQASKQFYGPVVDGKDKLFWGGVPLLEYVKPALTEHHFTAPATLHLMSEKLQPAKSRIQVNLIKIYWHRLELIVAC